MAGNCILKQKKEVKFEQDHSIYYEQKSITVVFDNLLRFVFIFVFRKQ